MAKIEQYKSLQKLWVISVAQEGYVYPAAHLAPVVLLLDSRVL